MSELDKISIKLKEVPLDGDFKHTLELLEESNRLNTSMLKPRGISLDKEKILNELSNGTSEDIINLMEDILNEDGKSIYNENGSIKSVYTVMEMLSEVWNKD